MSRYKVIREFSLHEDGTKFYQFFRVSDNQEMKAWYFASWGKFRTEFPKIDPSKFSRAVDNFSEMVKLKNSKKSRGYTSWKNTENEFETLVKMQDWCKHNIGSGCWPLIMTAFDGSMPTMTPATSPEPAATAAPVITTKPYEEIAAWGSW